MVDPKERENPESGSPEATLICEEWEALLAEKMDGPLSPEAEVAFTSHSAGCAACAELLEQAEQGREWLRLLEAHVPPAPVHLLSKILARTQGAGQEADYLPGTSALAGAGGLAVQGGRWGIPFLPAASTGMLAARHAHNARLLMTGAMAFFSVALTLSVAGVRLTSVHAAELRPQAVQANVSRSFYGTKKQVVSFYENLRLVYEVESKMREFRGDAEPPIRQEARPAGNGGTKAAPGKSGGGASFLTAPRAHTPAEGSAAADDGSARHNPGGKVRDKSQEQVEQVQYGWPVLVSYSVPTAASLHHKDVSAGRNEARTEETEAAAKDRPAIRKGAKSQERNRI